MEFNLSQTEFPIKIEITVFVLLTMCSRHQFGHDMIYIGFILISVCVCVCAGR